jgi:hypothetical protein
MHALLESTAKAEAVSNPLDPNVVAIPFYVSDESLLSALAGVIAGYIAAVDEQRELMNWPADEWLIARFDAIAAVGTALPARPESI